MPLGLEDSSWGNPLRRARHRSRTEAPHLSCPISSQTASQIRLQRSDHSRQQGASIRLASATLEEVIFDGVEPFYGNDPFHCLVTTDKPTHQDRSVLRWAHLRCTNDAAERH